MVAVEGTRRSNSPSEELQVNYHLAGWAEEGKGIGEDAEEKG